MAVAETPDAPSRRLPIPVKLFYGVGALGEAAFTTAVPFVFFYYTVGLGVSGALVGAALFLGLCADAVVDPFFGSWSDNIKSRFGRRIPLMAVAAPLLAVSVGLLFSPPSGLPDWGMFAWLAGWAIAVRAFFSMFHVPFVALGAEMSGDYDERSSVVAWRTVFLIIAGGVVTGLAYSVFFKGGLQLPERYPAFGWTVAAMVLGGAGLCVVGSARQASRLPGAAPVDQHLLRRLPGEVAEIFRNRSFRTLFVAAVLSYAAVGVNQAFNTHAYVFVFRLEPGMIQTVTFCFLGGLFAGVPLAPLVSRWVEKRNTVLIGMGLVSLAWTALGVSHLTGVFTATGADAVLPLAVLLAFVGLGSGFCAIAYPSMMADAADEHLHLFGRRREGLYFAGLGFAFKAGQGVGTLVAGVALDLMRFPKDAGRQTSVVLPDDVLSKIAFGWGPGAAVLAIASLLILSIYGLSRSRHAEVAAALRLRREAPAESA